MNQQDQVILLEMHIFYSQFEIYQNKAENFTSRYIEKLKYLKLKDPSYFAVSSWP